MMARPKLNLHRLYFCIYPNKKPDTFVSGFVPSAGIEPAQFPIGV